MLDTVKIENRTFVSMEQMPIKAWQSPTVDTPTGISHHPVTIQTLKNDDLFLITDTLGNISREGCPTGGIESSMGLFCNDTRFLSRLDLQIEGKSPLSFSSTADKGFVIFALCSNPPINEHIQAETIGIQREIVLKGGLFEEIELTNYNTHPIKFNLSLSFAADFLDLFEVRGVKRKQRGILLRYLPDEETKENGNGEKISSPQGIVLAYQGIDKVLMESRIQFKFRQPDEINGYTAIWNLELYAHESVKLGYCIHLFTDNRPTSNVSIPLSFSQGKAEELIEEKIWSDQICRIKSDNESFNKAIEKAMQDIHLLKQGFKGNRVLSAGVPWFATLFGRDSIIAASQTLILDPNIARDTLVVLAAYQGKVDNALREEEPGKILHEIRFGEMARCAEIPHTPYYGTVDATPLWLMLYSEYYCWTGDEETLDKLWDNATAAMNWIDRNCEETGYLRYLCTSDKGLPNQGWKDSDNCIVNREGKLAQGAITLSEVQGYIYAARIRMSSLAKKRNLPELADRWEKQAEDLKMRFNKDFWLPELNYCALALDGEGKPVDSITSNPGHCLQLGIFEPKKAMLVAKRLQSADMFTGWGIRTLSNLSVAYNPMGYHIGSVWPHDTSLIALGLRSLGLVDQSLELANGLIDMTLAQPYFRPPELFCGYEQDGFSSPVPYPIACSPQAWASGTIFQLISMMINLIPNASRNQLHIVDPTLPSSINRLSIENLQIGQTTLDLQFYRSGTRTSDTIACQVSNKKGDLRVMIEV